LDLAATALLDIPDLAKFAGRVSDSGEGRWTIAAGLDEEVPAPILGALISIASATGRFRCESANIFRAEFLEVPPILVSERVIPGCLGRTR